MWSADGKWIAYLKEPGENAGDEAERNTARAGSRRARSATPSIAKRFDGHVVTSTRTKRDGTLTLLGDPSVRRKNQLFVVAGRGRHAAAGDDSAPTPSRSVIWSADGQTLLFTADESEDDEYNSEPLADIYAVSVNGGSRAQAHDQSGLGDRAGAVAQGRPAGVRADAHARRREPT